MQNEQQEALPPPAVNEQTAAQQLAAFQALLLRIRLTQAQVDAICEATGCVNIAMVGLLSADQISRACKRIGTRAENPILINTVQEQLLLALRFWVVSKQRLHLPLNTQEFTMYTALNQAQLMRQQLEDDARLDKETVAKMPDKFKLASNWKIFSEAMETYLSQLLGSGRVPLSYVIRRNNTPDPDAVYDTQQEENVAIAPLVGTSYQRDNARVYAIIKQLVLEGPGRSYILPYDRITDGRQAWMALRNHYEGAGFKNRNVDDAYRTLEHLFYEGEKKGFTFEKFIEKHNESYLELERHGEPVIESKKVRDLLSRIKAPELQAAIQTVRANEEMTDDFQRAANFLALSIRTPAKQGQRIIGNVNVRAPNLQGRMGNRNQGGRQGYQGSNYQPGYQGGRGRGRGRGRNNRGGNGRGISRNGNQARGYIHTGYYDQNEWYNLSTEQKNQVLDARGTKRNVGSVDANAVITPNYDGVSVVSAITDGNNTAVTNHQGPANNGNSSNYSSAGTQFGRRRLNAIKSGIRTTNARNISTTRSTLRQYQENKIGFVELDSHADTSCVGADCRVLSITDQVCQVVPYHQDYQPFNEVPVVQAATAYDHPETGRTYILIINQALLVPNLETTLLNPNQMRANGIIVNDVPKHLTKEPTETSHSIYCPTENLRIPLQLRGIISGFRTRIPTINEIESCEWITLTAESPWNPKSEEFQENEEQQEKELAYYETAERHIWGINSNPLTPPDVITFKMLKREYLTIDAIETSKRTPGEDLEIKVANRFGIGLETAKRTLNATTQLALRHTLHPIHRRYRTQVAQLRYPRLAPPHGKFHTDIFFTSCPSIHGCPMGQMYTNDVHFSKFFPMKRKAEAPDTLMAFMQDVGIPSALHSDDAKELTEGKMSQIMKEFWIKPSNSEPYSPWQVRAELAIRELKKAVRITMGKTKAPKRLWDYCTMYHCEIRNLTALPIYQLNNRTPYEIVTGRTPDISEYLDFGWYDTIWYHDHDAPFPEDRRKLAKWLGVAHRVGQALCYYILPESGIPIARSTVQALTPDEWKDEVILSNIRDLNERLIDKLGRPSPYAEDVPMDAWKEDDYGDIYDPVEPDAQKPESGNYTPESYDALITAELLLPKGDILLPAKVVGRKKDRNGNPVGTEHKNPILDTRIYEVQFSDGHVEEYAANVIVENMYAQVDEDGNQFLMFDEIMDHKCDKDAMRYEEAQQLNYTPKTTSGWWLQVRWKDGSTSWEKLCDLKESNPIEVAEYAAANQIINMPAFKWWAHYTLKKRSRVIASIKSRKNKKKNHKFGIELPRTVTRALEIDKETGTTFWADAIAKEMRHVQPAFQILEQGEAAPIGYKQIPYHMNFEIKMDFTRKARLVAGGHMTDPPTHMTYSSVVARDSVRLAFLIAALNDLDLLAADIGNAYLNAPTKEKVYTVCGLDFGQQYIGRIAVIVKALYGLKSSGAAWHQMLANTLHDLGFKSCLADPDVWLRPNVKSTGEHYYDYIFVYVDDLLVLSAFAQKIMETIGKSYRFKDGSVGPPKTYLGAEVKEFRQPFDPVTQMWSLSADKYVHDALQQLEMILEGLGKRLPTKVVTPLTHKYRPELDTSAELDEDFVQLFQQLIGTLRWCVELGRIDIHLPVALLAQYLSSPRVGHLDQCFHIFAYLKAHSRSRIVLDPIEPTIDEQAFIQADWSDFYRDAKEVIPPNAPEPRGNRLIISCFVDADHAGNVVTRRSHTGILIFCNRAPIIWFSKKQNTVETSTFGSEFVAARIAVELIEGLRYKLRMLGIPLDGPANLFCDNGSVVANTTCPESSLKRKHNAIAYHRVREAVAQGVVRIAKEDGKTNLADILTKPLSGPRMKELLYHILY